MNVIASSAHNLQNAEKKEETLVEEIKEEVKEEIKTVAPVQVNLAALRAAKANAKKGGAGAKKPAA